MTCQVLGVSPSGYYAWAGRMPSARSLADAALTQRIKGIHEESRETYGVPRVHFELAVEGVRVGRKRVARLMKAAGLQGISRRKWIRNDGALSRGFSGAGSGGSGLYSCRAGSPLGG